MIGLGPGDKQLIQLRAFSSYMKYTSFSHSFCNGHILRELTFAHEEDNSENAGYMLECLMDIKEIVDEAVTKGLECLPLIKR
ncbi:MAG: transposase [Vulcanimicrobiota bacterium]